MYRDKWTPTVDYLDVGKDQVATQGGRSAGFGNKGMVLLFIYDDDAANNSDCVECAGRVAKQTFTTLKNFEVSEVVYASSSDNLKHIIRKLQPECIINASRTVAASILVPKAFTGTNTLAFLHRRWNCEWFGEHYLTVQTIPSSDIIYRDHLGKIPKEASFKLGEWHEAFKAAVLGNLYTVDTKHYQFHIIHTQKQWHSFYKRLKREKIVSIDTETRNLNRIVNDLGTIQFAFDGQTAYVLPFKHPDATWGNFLTSDIIPDLQEYFETTKALHIYANASFDIVQLRRELNLGWYSAGIWDIMRARYCLNENLKYRTGVNLLRSKDNLSGFSLAQITLEYGCNVYSKTAMGKSDRANTFGQPLTHLAEYGGADVVVPFQIYYFQLAEIARRGPSHARIPQVVLNQCKAMSLAFVEMELTGLPIDRAYLSKEAATAGAFNVAKEAIRAELYALPSVQKANRILLKSRHGADLFGRSSSDRWVFSIDTAEHCQLLFFEVLKLEPVTIGKNGQPSLSKAFKSKYAPIGENGELLDTAIQEVALFRDYSEAKHLWSAFIKGFYQKLVSNADMRWDARLRPSFDDLHVVTGRVSARKPSLQQVPSRSKLAKAIKRQFIANIGYLLLKVDFCLSGDSLIATENGLVRIDAIANRKDGNSQGINLKVGGVTGISKAVRWMYRGEKQTIKVATDTGNILSCTPDHRVKVLRNNTLRWIEAGKLKVGDYLCKNMDNMPKASCQPLNLSEPVNLGRNNTTGYANVYQETRGRCRWHSRVRVNGRYTRTPGNFATADEANTARINYAKELGVDPRNESFAKLKKPKVMTPKLAYILACIQSEGCVTFNPEKHTRGNILFSNTDLKFMARYCQYFYDVFGVRITPTVTVEKGRKTVIQGVETAATRDCYTARVHSYQIAVWLREMGLNEIVATDGLTPSYFKNIPDSVLQADKQSQMAFIAGYLEGDGSASNHLSWYSKSETMISQLSTLLAYHGYACRAIKVRGRYDTLKLGKEESAHIWRYLEPYMTTKYLEGYTPERESRHNGVPFKHKLMYSNKRVLYNGKMVDRLLKKLSKKDPKAKVQLDTLLQMPYDYAKVVSITPGKVEQVYDLSIHSDCEPGFMANGLVVHNCAHEVRNLAIASGDETLASAFNVGLQARKDFRLLDTVSNPKEWEDKFKALDLHRQNCQRFYGINPLDVTKEQRTAIKTVVFGTLYGMSAARLAASLNISEEAAQELIDKLFATFPAMSEYIFKTYEDGALNVQVVSGIGRVRHLWGYLHNSGGVHAAMDRRGTNCVDPETECLTEHGWRTVNKLKIGDKIYTKNLRSGELELQPIRKLFKSKYEGKMWRLDGSIDALVTPNHRWMVDWGRGKFDPACKTRFVTSKDLDDSVDNNPLHLVADSVTKQKGDGSWTDTEASILGWVLTDGHYDKQKGRNGAFISQSIRGNPDKVEVIERLLKTTGETYRRGKPDALGKIRWRIPIALAKRIRKALPDKTLTVEVLKSLTSKQLTLLYSAMLKGNGSWNSRSKIYSNFAAGTKHKADMFSMLCALVGVPCRVVSRSFPQSKWQYDSMPNVPKPSSECWFVNIKQSDRAQTKFYKSWVDYKGIVWCPNVDNGSFVARRNGSIYITGNSRIQSVSSDQGFEGNYNVQKLRWHFFTSQGIDLGFHMANSVHDSSETLARTEIIPVAAYLMETGYTTMVHRNYRRIYGLEFNVGLEIEIEVGAALSTTKDWNWRADDLRKLTLNSMEWQQSELNYQLDINRTMDAFDYNNELIQKIRKQELRDLPANGVAEHYYFTRDDAKKVKILKPVKRSLLS